jgi:hypothetical protein
MTTSNGDLGGGFPGGILPFGSGLPRVLALVAFSFLAAVFLVPRSGACSLSPTRGVRESTGRADRADRRAGPASPGWRSGGAGAGGDRAGDRLAGGGGSARKTTRAQVIVSAVSPGAIQMTRQSEATRRVMSFRPSACRVPLYRPSDTITRMRVLPGRDRPSAPSRALTARVKSSYSTSGMSASTLGRWTCPSRRVTGPGAEHAGRPAAGRRPAREPQERRAWAGRVPRG